MEMEPLIFIGPWSCKLSETLLSVSGMSPQSVHYVPRPGHGHGDSQQGMTRCGLGSPSASSSRGIGLQLPASHSADSTTASRRSSSASINPNAPILVDTDDLIRPFTGIYCWQRKSNTAMLHALVENSMNVFRQSLELRDVYPSHLGLVVDFGNGLASSLLSALLGMLRREHPCLTLLVTFLVPPDSSVYGIYAINAIMSTFSALHYCHGIMVRNLHSAQVLVNSEGNSNDGVEISDMLQTIACDLYATYNSMALRDLGILNFLTDRVKVFDVRSSLWRASRPPNKSKAKTDYNAVRAMATNLHALHIASNGDESQQLMAVPARVDNANIFGLLFSKPTKTLAHNLNPRIKFSEIKVAIEWASPSCSWSDVSILSRDEPFTSGNGEMFATAFSGHSSFLSNTSSAISTATSLKSAIKTTITTTCDSATAGNMPITAVAFTSPYASAYLHGVVDIARTLLERKAYLHSFQDAGNDFEDLVEACVGVQAFLETPITDTLI